MKKTVLITGVAGGIGRATAELFLETGWEVVGIDRRSVEEFSPPIQLLQADASNPESVEELFGWMNERYSGLDALVNNAAIQICKPLIDMSVEEWDDMMASNLRSIFLMARNSFPMLAAVKGSIINVSSIHAIATSRNIAAYAASKGGIVALTRAMALEFAEAGVRVNAVLPGAIDTQMLRDGLRRGHLTGDSIDTMLENLGEKTVMGRVGKPREIAQAILFLANSEQSSFMTGESMVIDGGATARLSTE